MFSTIDPQEVLKIIECYMDVEESGLEFGYNYIKGTIKQPVKENITNLQKILKEKEIAAFFSKENNKHVIKFGYIKQKTFKRRMWLHLLLFVATVFTTTLAGSLNAGGNPLKNPSDFWLGIPFSFALLLILGSHELGHYFTCRKYGVPATLPYFIPAPFFPVGTFGAVIRMAGIVPDRKALIRVGIAGPLVGFLIAIPVTAIGLFYSKVVPVTTVEGGIGLGSSLIFNLLTLLVKGNIPEGYDIVLHPVAFAGWFGFFVTALNLIPLGQLDGGHISYAILGRYRKYLTIATFVLLFTLGFFWFGWIFWAILIIILGLRHPPVSDEITPVDSSDIALGVLALVIFILTLIPTPFVWIK